MSYRRFPIILILTALLAIMIAVSACAQTAIDPEDAKQIMFVKDVRPGMKGYGKTVFRGTNVETFQVEVLGVLSKYYFGSDLVLVKLIGGPITQRQANLIEGMSGSPIYINGKLLGAFAFGYPFGREPLGMVTPIEHMLDAWNPALPSKPSTFYPMGTVDLEKPIPLGGHTFGKVSIDFGGEASSASEDTLVFRPLATTLLVSGMSARTMSWLEESLKPLNIRPVAGPGVASDKADLEVDIQPGSAVGVSFVTGDIDMTGIGTVTYRRGNRILAFGHPMMINSMMNGLGAIQAPLMSAYVYDIFPSIQISSKIAGPIKPIGTVFQDRPWSIGAEIGPRPEMIPVTVQVNDEVLNRKRNFKFSVINHPLLTSRFVVGATAEALFQMRGSPIDATARVKFEVTADEVGTITRENTFFDPIAIDVASVAELNQVFSILQYNPFYPVGVQKVSVYATIRPEHETAKIERIFVKEAKFEPGDTIEIGAVLKPFKGEEVTKTIKLQLPKDTPNGRMNIEVFGGMSSRTTATRPPETSSSTSTLPTIQNLRQMIKKFLEKEKNDELVARIVLPKSAPNVAGEKLSGLPPSISEAMRSSKSTMLGTEREEVKEVMGTDWVIFGSQRLPITVQKVEKSEKKSPSKKPSEPSASTPSSSSEEDEEEESEDDIIRLSSGLFGSGLVPLSASTEIAEEPAEAEHGSAPEKPAATPRPEPRRTASSTDEKPVGRTPTVWKQNTRTQFLTGTFKNTASTTGDLLTVAPSLELLTETSEVFVWCVLPDGKGNVYAGTGNNGIVYRIADDGTTSVFYDSPELQIHSLAMDSGGNLYAGSSPNGIVYKISSSGEATEFSKAEEKYIVALAVDGKDNVYAATGDKSKVYRIAQNGKSETVLDTSESHALSLAIDKDDNVYVGTGVNGIIYRIAADGKISIIYDAAEDSITALAVDAKGVLYAGTSPKGVLYKLAPDSTPKIIYDKADKGILGISIDEGGSIYAVSPASAFKILPDETLCTLHNDYDLHFLTLALGNGRLYAGTGNIGSVYFGEIGKVVQGTYESPTHDCGLPARWGLLEWIADVPEGSTITLQTRTGFVAEPDATWSGWSAPYEVSGSKIASPEGRYIQYLATLKASEPAASPKLKDVGVSYLPRNQEPKVTLVSPKGGEKWSGKKTIRWTGTDPDKDTLSYEVFYSDDGGANWKALEKVVQSAASASRPTSPRQAAASAASAPPEPVRIVAEISAELDRHVEIPQEMKDRILANAPGFAEEVVAEITSESAEGSDEPAKEGESEKPGNGTKQTSITWDTSKLSDGAYLVKVVGSDRLSNAADDKTGEAVSDQLLVVNQAPRLAAFQKTVTVKADKSVRLEGFASHETVGIAGVQFKVGANDWASALATDGIFDSTFEAFIINTQPLPAGQHTIEVKAIDQAGNASTVTVNAKVE